MVYQDLIALLTLASQVPGAFAAVSMPQQRNLVGQDSGQVQQDRLAAHEARARERAQKLKDQARGAELYLPWHSSESHDGFAGITVDEVNARSFEVGRQDQRRETLHDFLYNKHCRP